MVEIKSQEIYFTESKVIRALEKAEPESSFLMNKLVYYPYTFLEYTFQKGGKLTPLKGEVACTIDMISGVPSLVDKRPDFMKVRVEHDGILSPSLDDHRVKVIASDFLYKTIAKKVKVLTTPNISNKQSQIFYRPYWVVEGKNQEENQFHLIVDTITGKFHPLNLVD